MRAVLIFIVAVTAWCSIAQAAPDLAPSPSPTGPVTMKSVWDLHHHPLGGPIAPQLRSGVEADTDDWPASFYFTFAGSAGEELCTAALVGPQALLTAAHCIPPTNTLVLSLSAKPYTAICTIDPRYGADQSADWALCKINDTVPVPGNRFESVELTPLSAQQGEQLVLGGFGCTSDQVSQSTVSASPTYLIGSNTIAQTSQTASGRLYDAQFYAPTQSNWLFTQAWGTNICPGDSGGPAFRITAKAAKPYDHRLIEAVNSRVFYAAGGHSAWGASLLSATGGPDFAGWARVWATHNGVTVCGLNAGPVASCRQ